MSANVDAMAFGSPSSNTTTEPMCVSGYERSVGGCVPMQSTGTAPRLPPPRPRHPPFVGDRPLHLLHGCLLSSPPVPATRDLVECSLAARAARLAAARPLFFVVQRLSQTKIPKQLTSNSFFHVNSTTYITSLVKMHNSFFQQEHSSDTDERPAKCRKVCQAEVPRTMLKRTKRFRVPPKRHVTHFEQRNGFLTV